MDDTYNMHHENPDANCDPSKPDTEEVFNEARHSERHGDAPRSGMDADDGRARPDRYFLLRLRWEEAVGAGSVQYDGAHHGSVAHPVSACQRALRLAGRVRMRRWTG